MNKKAVSEIVLWSIIALTILAIAIIYGNKIFEKILELLG